MTPEVSSSAPPARRWRWGRLAAMAAILALAAAALAPFVRTDHLAAPLAAQLEARLGRRVDVQGRVRLRLLPSPAITANNVVIHDDPAAGIEPVAYVPALHFGPRLTSLLQGRLEPASIEFDGASINLAKLPDGNWNVQRLLETLWDGDGQSRPDIAVSLSSGRVNWKMGSTKLIYYLSSADIELWRGSEPSQPTTFRFEAGLSRTDRPARGYARVSGRGVIRSAGAAEPVEINVAVERSSISDLLTLFGQEPRGIEGFVAASARLRGDTSALDIEGRVRLDEVQRWGWLLPAEGGPALALAGKLDLTGERLELNTMAADGAPAPLSVRLRAIDYWTAPRFAGLVTLRGVPLNSLRELAENLGVTVPRHVAADGSLEGAVGYSEATGLTGLVRLSAASVAAGEAARLELPQADIVLGGQRLALMPSRVVLDESSAARMEGSYGFNGENLDLRVTTAGIEIERFRTVWEAFAVRPPADFFALCRGGVWLGVLRYAESRERAGQWAGEMELHDTRINIEGFAKPMVLRRAALALRGDAFSLAKMDARVGEIPMRAEYRYDPAAAQPHTVRLAMDEFDLAELPALLTIVPRSSPGFLARTFQRRPPPLPSWLGPNDGLETHVEIGSLDAGGHELQSVRADLGWNKAVLRIRDFRARLDGAPLQGSASVTFRSGVPRVLAGVQWEDYAWRGGRLRGEAHVETSGWWDDLVRNLKADGWFSGRRIRTSPVDEWSSMSGCFSLLFEEEQFRLELEGVSAAKGLEVYLGSGRTMTDGRLQLELASDVTLIRLTGLLSGEEAEFVRTQ